MNGLRMYGAAVCLAVAFSGCGGSGRAKKSLNTDSIPILERAWEFACAIQNDDKDKARSQEKVALTYLELGHEGRALALGRQIKGWRKGVVLADVASWLVERGYGGSAKPILNEAQSVLANVVGWQGDRIRMHIMHADALLSAQEAVDQSKKLYAGNRDYAGRVGAYDALCLAKQGNSEEAIRGLDALAEKKFFDTMVWRVRGYILLVDSGSLTPEQASKVLDTAWTAAGKVPGSMAWELQADVARATAEHLDRSKGEQLLEEVAGRIAKSVIPGHIRGPAFGRVLSAWARLGAGDKLDESAEIALQIISSEDLQTIEKPSAYALVAEAYAIAGMADRAGAHYGEAVRIASSLINPRPRALSCVDICVSLARAGTVSPDVEQGLQRLIGSFDVASRD